MQMQIIIKCAHRFKMNFLLMVRFALFFLLSLTLHVILGWWLRVPAAQAGQSAQPSEQPVMTVNLLTAVPAHSLVAVNPPALSISEESSPHDSPEALPGPEPVVMPRRAAVTKAAPVPASEVRQAVITPEQSSDLPVGRLQAAPASPTPVTASVSESELAEVFSSKPAFLQPPRQPKYPQQAQRRNQQGVVMVEVRLDASGRQRSINVVSSSGVESLDQAALEAVAAWHFRPERLAGKPVPSRVRIPIQFALMANR